MKPTAVFTILSLGLLGSCDPTPQSSPSSDWSPWERINQNDSALLIVDHQVGLYGITRDMDPTVFRESILAHASLGKLFNIPVVMTTSAETGPNGPLPKEITDMYPGVEVVQRKGEVK